MTQIETPNIAVIGTGYWGKHMVRNFYQLGALKLICDKNETLLKQSQDHYPDIESCIALNDVLSRADIQGVVIATPSETHYTIAREVLLSNKDVLVEKPMALHEEEGAELISIAKDNDRVLMVGHLMQYHPVFVQLKKIAAGGELGRINYIYSHRLNLGKIRREENILWSFAPHDVSMILSLAGESPESVFTIGGNYLHKKIADVTTTHMEFPSGLKAHIFVSWLHPFKEQKLVVVGDRKMAVFDDTKPWEDKLLLYPHEIKWENNIPVPAKAEPERLKISESEPLRLECECFLDCISNGNQPITDGQEGLRVLKILKASQQSLDNNGCGVELTPKRSLKNKMAEGHDILSFAESANDNVRDRLRLPRRSGRSYWGGSVANIKSYPNAFIHESAYIDENVEIGKDTKVWHFSHILSGSRIGEQCNIGQNVVIGPDVTIGNTCKIQNNVSVYKGVTIEDGVFCGPSMVFTNIINPRAEIRKMDQVRSTLVKNGATIGANATIICGITLGRYAFIGAGAVVTKNVPDHALVIGNPAKQIGWVCKCGERLDESIGCIVCGKKYEKNDNGLKPMPSDL
jgi:UDP-2-acetamido-3-amino-2,3-dideoxy-glucuronate N-acetyltransferase